MHARLTGWGRNHWSDCDLVEPETPAELKRAVDRAGTIARGLGRSYGDPATFEGHRVIGTRRLDRLLGFDEATGVLTCEAGVSLDQLLRTFAPRGWFPLITPGTRFVTIGGCIANDVHGKAHHSQGAFNVCVDSMRVLLADGKVVNASRTERADLFWASFGGMGLLGVVLDATIRLRRVETTYFKQRAIRAGSLEELLDAIDANGDTPYAVATIDPGATGKKLGRGVLTIGDHASLAELPGKLARQPLKVSPDPKLVVPIELPALTLNRVTAAMVNRVIDQVLTRAPEFAHYDGFFYPLDAIAEWNRGYGPRGFTQYQFVVPLGSRAAMRPLLETIVSSGKLPFLNVLKRMGAASQGHLSFPFEGYTLAIDFPIRDGTAELCRQLDAMVIDAGGRTYLGKDAFLEQESLPKMYARLEEWQAVKRKYDPKAVFSSDLARRVGLV